MAKEINISFYYDDHPEDVIDRLKFALSEMGIKMTMTERMDGCQVYSLKHATPLHGQEEN